MIIKVKKAFTIVSNEFILAFSFICVKSQVIKYYMAILYLNNKQMKFSRNLHTHYSCQ